MKILSGLVLASVLTLSPHTLASGVQVPTLHTVVGSLSTSSAKVSAAIASALSARASSVVDLDSAPEDRFIRVGPLNRRIMVPKHHCRADAKHDVVIHFHGVPTSVEPSVERSGLDAVVVIVNWGIGSGAYENYFQGSGALGTMLDWVGRSVDRACGMTTAGIRRVALSAWSAGYGAIYRILMHPEDRARVDALLMSDGMHVGYVRPGQVNPTSMQAYADFAHEAVNGQKLFAITHSDIEPGRYASTRETAEYLVAHENVELKKLDEQGPRPKMWLTSSADQGDFHMRGFAGTQPGDHAQHLHALGDFMFPMLRDHWARAQ
jgi:hypothetical protein